MQKEPPHLERKPPQKRDKLVELYPGKIKTFLIASLLPILPVMRRNIRNFARVLDQLQRVAVRDHRALVLRRERAIIHSGTSHRSVAVLQLQLLVEADPDLRYVLFARLVVALDHRVRLQRRINAAVQLTHVHRVVRLDAHLVQQRPHRVRLEPAQALTEIIVFRVERLQNGRTSSVLLPLVLPQPVRRRALLDVRPVLVEFRQQVLDLSHVEGHRFIAIKRSVFRSDFRRPNTVHGPRLADGRQATSVLVVPLHPLVASGLRPALREDEEIEILVGTALQVLLGIVVIAEGGAERQVG